MWEDDVQDALHRYLRAEIAAARAPDSDKPVLEMLANTARLEFEGLLHAFTALLGARGAQRRASMTVAEPSTN